MKFTISKANASSDQRPCAGAYLEEYNIKQIVSLTLTSFWLNLMGINRRQWDEGGFDHTQDDKNLIRYIKGKRWVIEIVSVDDLLKLCDTERCPLILSNYGKFPSIVLDDNDYTE